MDYLGEGITLGVELISLDNPPWEEIILFRDIWNAEKKW